MSGQPEYLSHATLHEWGIAHLHEADLPQIDLALGEPATELTLDIMQAAKAKLQGAKDA